MSIGTYGIDKLTEMICGDEPYTYFPHRSAAYLTKFFRDLDLDYECKSMARRRFVKSVLNELNDIPSDTTNMPSREMTDVIEYLLRPDHFADHEEYSHQRPIEPVPTAFDHERAIESVNDCLKRYSLSVVKDKRTNLVCLTPLLGDFVSTANAEATQERLISFCPEVFQVPEKPLQDKLVSVMMPFDLSFKGTFEAIKNACLSLSLDCKRADDIWDNSTFIQDIFELICCSYVVVVDFSGRNPNVMYETGIAHTLGKLVVPITQSIDDVPSDLRHHRVLKYLPNSEGYSDLTKKLQKRLRDLIFK